MRTPLSPARRKVVALGGVAAALSASLAATHHSPGSPDRLYTVLGMVVGFIVGGVILALRRKTPRLSLAPWKEITLNHSTSSNKNALLLLRGGALTCILILALSLTVFKEGPRHAFCVGLALGLLIGLAATTFQIRALTMSEATRPPDAGAYSIR